MKLQEGDIFTIRIERLGLHGEGVGLVGPSAFTLFVEGALPGEEVKVRLVELHARYGKAVVVDYVTTSPLRVQPICPLFGRCGGCQLMHLQYLEQLKSKEQRVKDALERIGKLPGITVAPCVPSPSPLAYRNKIQLPVAETEEGVHLGLYAAHSHDIVKVEHCFIHCPLGEEVFQEIQKLLKRQPLPVYDPLTGRGILRQVIVKTAVYRGEALVVLVTSQKNFTPLLPFAQAIMEAHPAVKGVLQNVNPSKTNVVLGSAFYTLAGQPTIEEQLAGLSFNISGASFFQVNSAQAENLYRKALALSELTGKEIVLDAYAGVGTLSLLFAKEAKEVIGVEVVEGAVHDAKANAVRNGITNAQFFHARAEQWIERMKEVHVALLNPPRKGCEASFLEKLALLRPSLILYISCDPATLGRDLAFLCQNGYSVDVVQPFDMFPQTAHVETLVKLRHEGE